MRRLRTWMRNNKESKAFDGVRRPYQAIEFLT
jgi:hypothetical protein